MDIRQTEYAEFLERVCKIILTYKPKAIAFLYVCKNGDIGASYYDCSMCDKMAMAGMLQYHATTDGIADNPDWLRRVIEEGEG